MPSKSTRNSRFSMEYSRSIEHVCASWDSVKEAVPNYQQEFGVILLRRVLAIAPHTMAALIFRACKKKNNVANKSSASNASARSIGSGNGSTPDSSRSIKSEDSLGYNSQDGTIQTDRPAFFVMAKRLVRIIDLMVHLMSVDLHVATEELMRFGADFARSGVRPHHYTIFQEAFLETLIQVLEEEDEYGVTVTKTTKSSWKGVFKFVSKTLIRGAADAGYEKLKPPVESEPSTFPSDFDSNYEFSEPVKFQSPTPKLRKSQKSRRRSCGASVPLSADESSVVSETKSLSFLDNLLPDDQSMTSASTTSTLEQKRRLAREKRQAALDKLEEFKQNHGPGAAQPKSRLGRVLHRRTKTQRSALLSPAALKRTTARLESAKVERSERRMIVERSTNHYLSRID